MKMDMPALFWMLYTPVPQVTAGSDLAIIDLVAQSRPHRGWSHTYPERSRPKSDATWSLAEVSRAD